MSVESGDGPFAALRRPFEGPNTMGNSPAFWLGLAVAVAVLAAMPVLFGLYAAEVGAVFLAYALLGMSLAFIWGYCGILSFGQVAFFGVAGYAFGIVAINAATLTGLTVALLAAIAVSTVFAAALGYFMFYGGVRDVYVTILTLVVALVLYTFMGQTAGGEWTIGDARLGGFNGMSGVPDLAVGVGSTGVEIGLLGHYYVTLGALVATYLGLRALVNSQFGYAMVATREDEDRTAMFGYDTTFIKLVVFTIGGAVAGLGGVLFTTQNNYVDPSVFGITAAALPVVWASVGGRTSLLGTVGAALAIQFVDYRLALSGSEWALVLIGSLLVFVVLLMPEGVAPRLHEYVLEYREDADPSPVPREPPAATEEVSD
ncbi:inner-membrane translocator [Natronococcus amylolyticus DSM 10524]|uniref:Inner-membrane translocator n=1 Tax=Natronococcus amylolyticus DSM 10524 TaxID=1227497 RepID=L9X9I4_9EURY|nr:inner-membrane translocator [Natronococcus amylolyticus]ELY58081.1 inner-membrane translocator [Natronococcus amylolyticus DSM 10524]